MVDASAAVESATSSRRGFLARVASAGLVAGAGLAGCASATAPGGAPAAPRTRSYTETISSVLISDDGKHLVAIGKRHHYIFDAPPVLVRALQSKAHPGLTAIFSPFHVDLHAHIEGDVTLQLPADASDDERREAEAAGLARQSDGTCQWTGHLTGQRYTGWTYEVATQRDKLNRAYTIEINTDETAGSRIVDEAATPIRVAADGVQLIYYAPLAPIIIPMIFLLKANDH